MEFKKIQLNGFKSFADKTSLLIEDGLTGIVGPNGCGKSNIVESLRWCMGETSAKSMRGSGMEDVIFSGTSNKPSKNIAEVIVNLSNDGSLGSHNYKHIPEIEIRRKIEKDKGSKFHINGKEVRAKDAQMFFADLSTGAHSPSLISQGRIGSLVTAKPSDRRAILEEAAGISGLHARRHEAEVRLNAAENNLKRADELRRQQEKQLANLQKQAEEAGKYKMISEEIKKIEAGLYFLLRYFTEVASKKISKGLRILLFIILAVFAVLFAIGGKVLLTLPLTLASLALLKLKGLSIFQLISLYRLIQTLRNSGRFSFNQYQNNNSSSLSISEAYKILNLDINKKPTKEIVNKAYQKIQKKIHPDISPETSRLSAIVNEAKEIVLKDIS